MHPIFKKKFLVAEWFKVLHSICCLFASLWFRNFFIFIFFWYMEMKKNVKVLISLPILCCFSFFFPGWFRSILPKSALRVEEEAWNAYPYTKTRYKCPFVEKFFLEIETRYQNDGGEQDNIFNLTDADKQQRQIGE